MDLALRESQKTDMEQYNYIDLLLPRKQGLRCMVNYALCVCIYTRIMIYYNIEE